MFDEFATIAGSTASVLLLPIFALQGTQVRKRTPKVPGAAGAPFGGTDSPNGGAHQPAHRALARSWQTGRNGQTHDSGAFAAGAQGNL